MLGSIVSHAPDCVRTPEHHVACGHMLGQGRRGSAVGGIGLTGGGMCIDQPAARCMRGLQISEAGGVGVEQM